MIEVLPDWPAAFGGPACSGNIKQQPEDFQVTEALGFTPDGVGEHVFLLIEKRGENTEYVARLLARFAGVRQRDIGYAGLKDRHAVTRQWFSVWLPGRQAPDWQAVETDQIKILQALRHSRKLKRGALQCNHFDIRIRNWQGDAAQFEQQLTRIKQAGFPNYFTEQRFGRQGQNIEKALALFAGKRVKHQQRSLYLSAVRSWLFNQILADRVRQNDWNCLIEGDICQLNHSHSQFPFDPQDESLAARCQAGDLHPTGLMAGKTNQALPPRTQTILQRYPALTDGLVKQNVNATYRALRAMPEQFGWRQTDARQWLLSFSLPPGCYATALLREVINPA